MSLNKVMLIGNAGQDPEVRYLEGSTSNTKVATFRLATTDRYRDRNSGETREQTEWHNIVAWSGKGMPDLSKIEKGIPLYVCGRLRSAKFTGNDGTEKQIYEVVASRIAFEDPSPMQCGL